MKSIIRDFIPPVVFKLLKRNKQKVEPTYSSYEQALSHCSVGLNYENDDDLIKVVLAKTIRLKEKIKNESFTYVDSTTAFGALAVQNSVLNNEINVLDFGGACGAHYFIYKKILDPSIRITWNVVETSLMVSYAKILETTELRFFDNLDLAIAEPKRIDLVFSSGAIQYVNDPREILRKLTKLGVKKIFLSRLSLTTGLKDIICIQRSMLGDNGIGDLPDGFIDKIIEYPHTSIKNEDLTQILSNKYSTILKFDEKSGIHKINSEPIIGYGIFLKEKTQ